MWISEQTAIISLYSINWLVFITETEGVYCAVRTDSSSKIPANFSLGGRVMAQAVSRRPVITEFRTGTQVSLCGICVRWSGTGTGLSTSILLFSFQYHSTSVPYCSSSTCCRYQKDKRAKPRSLPICTAMLEIRNHYVENYFTFFSFWKGSVRGCPSCRPEGSASGRHDTRFFGFFCLPANAKMLSKRLSC